MSALSHQSAINPNRNFWLKAGTISSLTVDSLTVNGLATISSVLSKYIQTRTISSGSIEADTVSFNTISTGIIDADYMSADILSTIQLNASMVDIHEGTISTLSTNAIELNGAYLTTQNGTELLLNGIPIATTANLSSIQDWSVFPAYSTIMPTDDTQDVGSILMPFRQGFFSTVSTGSINVSTVNGHGFITGSNWSHYPAQTNVEFSSFNACNIGTANMDTLLTNHALVNTTFSVSNVLYGNQFVNADPVGYLQVQTGTDYYTAMSGSLLTSKNGGGDDVTQINGSQITVTGGVSAVTSIDGGDITTQNIRVGDIVTEQADVSIYGRYLPAGDNALYVSGGFTQEGGFTHGFSAGCAGAGTYPASAMANRIDLLPIGTQSFITFGATAMIAGLGITIDSGLGINLASGLIVDVLANDVQLRANDDITLDADDGISMVTGGTIAMNADSIIMTANNLVQTTTNFVFNDSNFTVNSSNENTFNATKVSQGTILPPSTIGFYSTINQNSQINNSPFGAFLTSLTQFGLYQNISSVSWVVESNISTIYTPGVSSVLSTYTSSFTSSLVRGYSTLAFLQDFPSGEVSIKPSSLLLQHADLIELDTKPFPIYTTLTPGLSSILSSLYTYEAITDGSKYSEIGEIKQTVVPVTEYISSYYLSSGVSSGTVLSTLTSSFFSTLVSQQTFESTIFNQMLFNRNALSTTSLLVSSINGSAPLPYPYASFTGNYNQVLGIPNSVASTIMDTTEIASGIYLVGASTSKVAVSTTGVYRFSASPQFDTSSGGQQLVEFWFQKNGVAVPRSASRMTIQNNGEIFASVETIMPMDTYDYVETCFTSSDGNMSLSYTPASVNVPAVPGIIFNVTKLA